MPGQSMKSILSIKSIVWLPGNRNAWEYWEVWEYWEEWGKSIVPTGSLPQMRERCTGKFFENYICTGLSKMSLHGVQNG